MILKNAKIDGKITDLKTNGGIIESIGKTDEYGVELGGKNVIPGLIDIHIHGAMGQDTMDGKFDVISEYLAENGVTSFLPTLVPTNKNNAKKITSSQITCKGAQIIGFHYEGPFLSKAKKGALDDNYLIAPYKEIADELENIKMMTVSPNLPGICEFIKNAPFKISLGHTDCNYMQAVSAIEAGADCVTHIFNAMPPFLHREPSLIGAAIDKNIYAQIICDGEHICRSAVFAMYKTLTSDRLILISDSMSAAGLPDGKYMLGSTEVTVKDSTARTNTGALAGSTSSLWKCVNKAVEFGISFEEAVKMASKTPAQLLGIKKGQLIPGYDADFVVLSENREIEAVYVAGKRVR